MGGMSVSASTEGAGLLYLPLHNIYVESSGTHLLCVGFPSQSFFVNVYKSI